MLRYVLLSDLSTYGMGLLQQWWQLLRGPTAFSQLPAPLAVFSCYLGLAAAGVADDEDRMPHLQQLLQLHHLQHKAVLRLQLQLQHRLLDDLGESRR